MEVKIRNSNRQKKKANQPTRKQSAPKKNSVWNTVHRWERKFGYNFTVNEVEIHPYLKNAREEFEAKAVKYCGGYHAAKKQTRFDKMKLKEEMGFKLERLPIMKKFQRADQIIETLYKKFTMLKLRNCK